MTEHRVSFEAISVNTIDELSVRFYQRFEGILAERDGRISVSVYTDAESGFAAARSVIEDLETVGFSIVRVDLDLVDSPEIAERLNVSRQAVNNWARGSRGRGFPHPLGSPGGKRIWSWGQITEWAATNHRKFRGPSALSLDDAVAIDHFLAQRRAAVTGGSRAHIRGA